MSAGNAGLSFIGPYVAESKSVAAVVPLSPKNASSVILCIRTLAVWNKNRWVGFGLLLTFTVTLILECYYLHLVVKKLNRYGSIYNKRLRQIYHPALLVL